MSVIISVSSFLMFSLFCFQQSSFCQIISLTFEAQSTMFVAQGWIDYRQRYNISFFYPIFLWGIFSLFIALIHMRFITLQTESAHKVQHVAAQPLSKLYDLAIRKGCKRTLWIAICRVYDVRLTIIFLSGSMFLLPFNSINLVLISHKLGTRITAGTHQIG